MPIWVRAMAPLRSLAMPKSPTLTITGLVLRMLAALMSLWMMFLRCSSLIPMQTWMKYDHTRSSGKGLRCASRFLMHL